MSTVDDLDIDLDVEIDEPTGSLYVFEQGTDEAKRAFAEHGVEVTSVSMGSELMGAAKEHRISALIMSVSADEELRQLFMRAFKGRFAHIPVVYLTPDPFNPEVQARLSAEGATHLLNWPLPPVSELLPFLDSVAPFKNTQSRPVPEPGSNTAVQELGVLKRKVEKLDAPPSSPSLASHTPPRPREVLQAKAIAEENTTLRSEVTVMRDRQKQLEDRLLRMKALVEQLNLERDELKAQLAGQVANDGTEGELTAIKKALGGLDSYVWALEEAVQFLEDLKLMAGDRAPTLDAHIRTLKVTRQFLGRLMTKA